MVSVIANRYLSDQEVLRRIFKDSYDEKNDLSDINSSESELEPDEGISPSTCND